LEKRHYHTKVGTGCVGSEYVQPMCHEVVLLTKAIREDLKEDSYAVAEAVIPKIKLDKTYDI
jgi:hypothetical protein